MATFDPESPVSKTYQNIFIENLILQRARNKFSFSFFLFKKNMEISQALRTQFSQEVADLKQNDQFFDQRMEFLSTEDFVEQFDEILNKAGQEEYCSLYVE